MLEELAYELGKLRTDANEASNDDNLGISPPRELGVGSGVGNSRRRRLLEQKHDSLDRQLPSRREGRIVKRAREHHTNLGYKRQEIPDVSLSTVNDFWDDVNSKRRLQ